MKWKATVTACLLSFSLQSFACTADEKLIDWMVENGADKKEAPFILAKAKEAGKERGVDYLLLLAIMRHESNFRKGAVSKSGSLGLMQVHKASHRSKIGKNYLSNVDAQIKTGAEVYVEIRNRVRNDRAALLRYSNNKSGYDQVVLQTRWRLRTMTS